VIEVSAYVICLGMCARMYLSASTGLSRGHFTLENLVDQRGFEPLTFWMPLSPSHRATRTARYPKSVLMRVAAPILSHPSRLRLRARVRRSPRLPLVPPSPVDTQAGRIGTVLAEKSIWQYQEARNAGIACAAPPTCWC